MNSILTDAHLNIEQSLKNCYTTTVSLALTLDNKGIPQNFEAVSKQLIKSNPLVSVVQMVPNGVIKYIYPLNGNEAALDLNILNVADLKKEAKESINTQKVYFAGPLKLRQGGIGIVGRLPVYHNNSFWGFTAVIVKLETLLETSGINSLNHPNYYFQVSKKNPITYKEQFFLPSKTSLSKSHYVSQEITDSDIKLYLVAKKAPLVYPEILFSSILGLIVAALFGILTTKLLKKPEELRYLLKKQEEKLLKNEMKFKTIFDQATIGFAIIDAKTGYFIDANHKCCEMLGFPLDEMKEKSVKSIIHPDDVGKILKNIKKLNNGKIAEFVSEKRSLTKTGKYIWVNLTVYPLKENGDEPKTHIVFFKDITTDKESEEDLKISLQLVTEQNKRLLNFSYIVSHNLRSHTSNIEAIIALIESTESEEERNEMMNLLKSVSNSLNETISHLNEVVNVNANLSLVIAPLNLKEYIVKTQEVLYEQIELSNATFIIDVPEDAIINYNSAYLESILYNLISNAIRYRHPQRKPIITIKLYKESKKDVLEIADNGIGIDMEKNGEKLFGMYKTFHTNSDARGMGLFITRNQIETMDGKITTNSTPDSGSTFKIYIK